MMINVRTKNESPIDTLLFCSFAQNIQLFAKSKKLLMLKLKTEYNCFPPVIIIELTIIFLLLKIFTTLLVKEQRARNYKLDD